MKEKEFTGPYADSPGEGVGAPVGEGLGMPFAAGFRSESLGTRGEQARAAYLAARRGYRPDDPGSNARLLGAAMALIEMYEAETGA